MAKPCPGEAYAYVKELNPQRVEIAGGYTVTTPNMHLQGAIDLILSVNYSSNSCIKAKVLRVDKTGKCSVVTTSTKHKSKSWVKL